MLFRSREQILEILLQRKIGRSSDDSQMLEIFLKDRIYNDLSVLQVIKILIDHGAETNPSLLRYCLRLPDKIFQFLLEKIVSAENATECLRVCCNRNLRYISNHESLRKLIHYARSLGAKDLLGEDPVTHLTPFQMDPPPNVLSLLVEEGGDINQRNKNGVHPLIRSLAIQPVYRHRWADTIAAWQKCGAGLTSADFIGVSQDLFCPPLLHHALTANAEQRRQLLSLLRPLIKQQEEKKQ